MNSIPSSDNILLLVAYMAVDLCILLVTLTFIDGDN